LFTGKTLRASFFFFLSPSSILNTEEEEEIKDEFTKMAEKLAPEKRHIFLHNGTFLFHLSNFIPFHFSSIKLTYSSSI